MLLLRNARAYHGRLAQVVLVATAAVSAPACGDGTTELTLSVEAPEGPQAFAEVETVEVQVNLGVQRIAFSRQAYEAGRDLLVPDIPRKAGVEVTVVARDVFLAERLYGSVEPDIPDQGEICCVTLCLCSPALHAAAGCECDGSRCSNACR